MDKEEMGAPIVHTYSSHTHVTPRDVHPFRLIHAQIMT